MSPSQPFRPGNARQERGRRSEQLACGFLKRQGFVIERTNVRFPVGEIDIVAREGQTLCFVEVRSTGSRQWGGPLASITDRKRRHLIQAARWYLSRFPAQSLAIRFDVVAIDWRADASASVELVRGAFDSSR